MKRTTLVLLGLLCAAGAFEVVVGQAETPTNIPFCGH